MAELKPRVTTVTLFQGDDTERLEELRRTFLREAEQAFTPSVRRVADAPQASTAADEYNAFLDEATERAVKVTLRALGRKAWRDLVRKHPVRTETKVKADGTPSLEKNPEDEQWGFNFETLCDDLVPACVTSPEHASEEFLDSLADGDWNLLYASAVTLNTGLGIDPKARLRSVTAQTSGEISRSPERSA